MGVFRQFVQGLYLAAGFAGLLLVGEALLPGNLDGWAFSGVGLFALGAMMVLDAVFSLRLD